MVFAEQPTAIALHGASHFAPFEDLTLDEANTGLKSARRSILYEVCVMNQATQAAAKPAEMMKNLMLEIVHALVDQPEEVVIETIDDHESTVIRLRVAHQDIGKVIGKQGRTARSLRTILGAASMKLHHRFALDIVEDRDARE